MNKLVLAQTVNTLAATQGEINNAETATGYQSALVLMVDKAYKDIQTYRKHWNFMRATVEKLVTAAEYTITDPDIREVLAIRYDYNRLTQENYDNDYLLQDQSLITAGWPNVFVVNPFNRDIILNPLDEDYRINIDYYRVPHVLTTNSTVPIIPAEHHYVIVYKALMNLGSYLGNDDLINEYQLHYGFELGELMQSQLPPKKVTTRSFV